MFSSAIRSRSHSILHQPKSIASLSPLPSPILQLVLSSPLHRRPFTSTPVSQADAPASASSAKFPDPVPGRYAREVPIVRDLPQLQSRTPLYLAIAIASAISWGGFLFYATNNERANSSVVRSLTFQLRNSTAVADFLGDNVRLVPLFGEFRKVAGSINMLAGKIDVQFRVTGSKAKGTASFTSFRRGKEGRFEVLRWRITRDDGQILDLAGKDPRLVRGDGGEE